MTAKDLYTKFCELFPNLRDDIKSYYESSKGVLQLKSKRFPRKPAYMFIYRSDTSWELHFM